MLGAGDIARLNRCIQGIYVDFEPDDFALNAARMIDRLISSESTAYSTICVRRNRVLAAVDTDYQRYTPQFITAFEAHIHEHPLIEYCRRQPGHAAKRISDFVPKQRFWRTGLYNEFFRPLGLGYQMAVGIPLAPDIIIGLTVNRGSRDYSQRERLLLDLLRPHIHRAYRAAESVARLRRELNSARQTCEELR